MVEVETDDIWRVTHRIGAIRAVFSDSYQQRQCKHLLGQGAGAGAFRSPFGGTCQADYLYHLLLAPDGSVHGWLDLHNPERVVAVRDRYVVIDPSLRRGPGWPVDALLRPVVP